MITLHKYVVNAIIESRYAKITYTFDFENNEENGNDQLKFDITIDPGAFMSSFVAYIDGKVFDGKVTPKGQNTNSDSSDTKSQDANAIFITQPDARIPNVFRIQMTINPKSKILVNITIEQYLRKILDFNHLNIELLTNFKTYTIERMFRCIPFKIQIDDSSAISDIMVSSSGSSSPLDVSNDRNIIINKNDLDNVRRNATIHGIILLDDACSINELIVKYKTKSQQNESHHLYDVESHTFCHILSDIITKDINLLLPRRVVFVIGTSGINLKKTMSAIIHALNQLRVGYDRYCIMLFDTNMVCFPTHRTMMVADTTNIAQSIQFCCTAATTSIGEANNINDALLKAIECIKHDIERVHHEHSEDVEYHQLFMNQLIFITDCAPLNTTYHTIQEQIATANQLKPIDGYNTKISIFTFGVGRDENNASWMDDLNHSFLRSLALNNDGFYKRIKKTTADMVLKKYLGVLSTPMLCNIRIDYDDKQIENLTTTKFNALYAGNELIVCGIFHAQDMKDDEKDIVLNATISAITGEEIKSKENPQSAPVVKAITIEKKVSIVFPPPSQSKENSERAMHENVQKIWAHLTLHHRMRNEWIESEKNENSNLALPSTMSPLSVSMIHQLVTPWTEMVIDHTRPSSVTKSQNLNQVKQKAQQMMNSLKGWSPRKHINAVQDGLKRLQKMKVKANKNILYSKSFSFDDQSRSGICDGTTSGDAHGNGHPRIYPKPPLQQSKSFTTHKRMPHYNKPTLEASVSRSLTSNCTNNHSTPNSVDLLYSTPNSPSEALQDASRNKWVEPKRIRYQLSKRNCKGEIFELYEWLKPTKLLGVGAYAAVCEVIDTRSNMKYAVKKNRNIFSNQTDARRILREIKLMCHLAHPHVMNLCGVIPPSPYERDTYQDCYLIMPRMDGTLSSVIASNQTLSQRHIQYFIYQIARGLEYMHSGGIIHRDLKPDNILVSFAECTLKITDFGMSRGVRLDIETPQQLTEYVVTRWYRAPEIICCSKLYDYEIDIWALGCIAAELYTRTPIFKGRNCLDQLQLIFHYLGTPQDVTWITNPNVKKWICGMPPRAPFNLAKCLPNSTSDAQDFIRQLLILNPHKRPNIRTAIQHAWLKEFVEETHYRQCPPFNISFEYEALIKTQFGVRHMMYTELHKFRKEFVREERGRTFQYPHQNIQQ